MKLLSKYHRTLIACCLVLLVASQRFMGAFAVICILPFCLWLIYSVFIVCTKPEKRKQQLVRIAVWLVTGVIIWIVLWHRSEAARHDADNIIVAIKKYKAEHGAYPSDLEAIGRDSRQLKKELRLYYWPDGDKPAVLYASTLSPFDRFDYDFGTDRWIFRLD